VTKTVPNPPSGGKKKRKKIFEGATPCRRRKLVKQPCFVWGFWFVIVMLIKS
jgi:hypothetical protein